MDTEAIKTQILKHLDGGAAFLPLGEVLDKLDYETIGSRVHGLPYSAYELFYHISFAQNDILRFCTEDGYDAPKWPDSYWPLQQAPENKKEWEALKESYFQDREALGKLVKSPDTLTRIVKNGDTQTLFRELLLVIEHTAYHTGQLMILSRLLG